MTNDELKKLEDRVSNVESILKEQRLWKLSHAYRHDPSKLIAIKFEKEDEFVHYMDYLHKHDLEWDVAGGRIVVLLKSDYELTRDAIQVPVKEMPVKRGLQWLRK